MDDAMDRAEDDGYVRQAIGLESGLPEAIAYVRGISIEAATEADTAWRQEFVGSDDVS